MTCFVRDASKDHPFGTSLRTDQIDVVPNASFSRWSLQPIAWLAHFGLCIAPISISLPYSEWTVYLYRSKTAVEHALILLSSLHALTLLDGALGK